MAKMYPAGPCKQAFHGTLPYRILQECVKTTRHWKHTNAAGDASWWGPVGLSENEMAIADHLREVRDAHR